MTSLKTLIFYATPEHPCSYLPNRKATTLFVDPRVDVDQSLYSQLTQQGFRRSGAHYYRPHCRDCQACIPVRIPVARFQPDRAQRRVTKTHADLMVERVPVRYSDEYYQLYERYIHGRHSDGDMYPPSRRQFTSFLIEGNANGFFMETRDREGRLKSLAAIDTLRDGLSAVYTLYDPADAQRSYGSHAILWQIQEAKRQQLPYVYLGYLIDSCRKMSYKARFQPLERLRNGQWVQDDARDPVQLNLLHVDS